MMAEKSGSALLVVLYTMVLMLFFIKMYVDQEYYANQSSVDRLVYEQETSILESALRYTLVWAKMHAKTVLYSQEPVSVWQIDFGNLSHVTGRAYRPSVQITNYSDGAAGMKAFYQQGVNNTFFVSCRAVYDEQKGVLHVSDWKIQA